MTNEITSAGITTEQVILYFFDLVKIILPILLTAYISYRVGKKRRTTVTKEQLQKHPVFVRLKGYRDIRIVSINAGTKRKSELAQKYATIFLNLYDKELNDVIENSSMESTGKMIDIHLKILARLEEELSHSGIYKMLLDCLKLEHSFTFDEVYENLNELDQRTGLNYFEKLDRALYSFRSIIGLLMNGLGPRIEKMNGKLEALIEEEEKKGKLE